MACAYTRSLTSLNKSWLPDFSRDAELHKTFVYISSTEIVF